MSTPQQSELAGAPEAPLTVPADPVAEASIEEAVRERVLLEMPVDVRSAALAVLVVLACGATLYFARALFIPLLVSLLLTYALAPLVERLARWHVSRWIGSALVLLVLAGGIASAGYKLSDGAADLFNSLPKAAQKLSRTLRAKPPAAKPSALDTVQKAATQIESAAEQNSARPVTKPGTSRVVVEKAPFNVRDYVLSGTLGLITAAGQLTLVLFLTFFALASGDTFRRKLVRITGPTLGRRRVTVHVLDEISDQIQRFLMVQIGTSVLVGVATGLAFWALGLDNAAVWGIVAAIANLIPYVGSLITMAASSLVAFLQFDGYQTVFLVAAASLLIHTVVGNLLMPWLTSRTSRMNPVSVFVNVIFWGWLWGLWGLLLAIPIMMVIKAVCDRVEGLQPIGELLGE